MGLANSNFWTTFRDIYDSIKQLASLTMPNVLLTGKPSTNQTSLTSEVAVMPTTKQSPFYQLSCSNAGNCVTSFNVIPSDDP